MKDRVEGWLGGTYRIFEKPAGITKLFRSDPYTDEAYTRAVNLFRRYLQKTDPNARRDADGNLLVNAPHIPVHLGAMSECVKDLIATVEFKDGDIFFLKHDYANVHPKLNDYG